MKEVQGASPNLAPELKNVFYTCFCLELEGSIVGLLLTAPKVEKPPEGRLISEPRHPSLLGSPAPETLC